MNILFYLQPYIIRDNPFTFEWIYPKYLSLGAHFKQLGFSVSFVMNDTMKAKHARIKYFEYISPSDFSVEFAETDWLKGWREVLVNEDRPGASRFLNNIFDKIQPDVVFVWNFDAALKKICGERGVSLFHQELGLVRNPMLYQVDFEGLLWGSSLGKLFNRLKDRIELDNKSLDDFISQIKGTINHPPEEVIKKLDFNRDVPTILIPLQVEDDSNIVVGSPFKTMREFVSFVFERLTGIENCQFVIKKHPHQPDVELPSEIKESGNVVVVSDEFSNMDLINAGSFVFTINSTSGFEALLLSKPVFTFGKSPFSNLGFTKDVGTSAEAIELNDAVQLHNKKYLRKFLYFTIFHYHLHEEEMWDCQFYSNLWEAILSAKDDPEEFYLAAKGIFKEKHSPLETAGEGDSLREEESHHEQLHHYKFKPKGAAMQVPDAAIMEKDLRIGKLESIIWEKDSHIKSHKDSIKELREHFENLEDVISEKNEYIKETNILIQNTFKEKDTHIEGLENAIKEKDEFIRETNTQIENSLKVKDTHIKNLETTIKAKDEYVKDLHIHIKNLETAIKERIAQIGVLDSTIIGKDTHIGNLEGTINRKDTHIGSLEGAIKEKDTHIGFLEDAIKGKDANIGHYENALREKDAVLNHIYSSHSWKALLLYYEVRNRIFPVDSKRKKIAGALWESFRSYVSAPIKKIWWRLNSGYSGTLNGPEAVSIKLPVIKECIDKHYKDATVSVIIPTKNAGSEFKFFLSMLREQKGFKNIEIVVVDSGSTDETIKTAREYGAKIIEIPQEKFSHSYSRNLGVKNALGKYLFFTVQDALPPSSLFLYELLSVLKDNDVAAVSCAEFPRADADLFYCMLFRMHYKFLEVDKNDRIMSMPKTGTHINLRRNGQLSDLACLISRKIFLKYKHRYDYAEDLDLGIRLIKDGYKLAFLNSVRIIHSHNRPPYYFLKRAYVDNVFLTKTFPDHPVLELEEQQILNDIFSTYESLNQFIYELTKIKLQIGVEELFDIVDKTLKPVSRQNNSSLHDIVYSSHAGEELNTFLRELGSSCHALDGHGPNNNILINSVLHHISMLREYMIASYPLVCGDLLADFKECIFKVYAYQCGAQLAHCYLNGGSNIKGLHNKLLSDI